MGKTLFTRFAHPDDPIFSTGPAMLSRIRTSPPTSNSALNTDEEIPAATGNSSTQQFSASETVDELEVEKLTKTWNPSRDISIGLFWEFSKGKSMSERLELLVSYCKENGRVGSMPMRWKELYELLPDKRRNGVEWEPPLP